MEIFNLSENNSVLNTFLSEIRAVNIQQDAMRFRRNIERIGEILSYELSKTFEYSSEEIITPLDTCKINLSTDNIVVCSILRAGLPLHNGILNYFDNAENAFISAYRKHVPNSNAFNIEVEYLACPDLSNKTVILADPMLATGQSIMSVYEALKPFGTPKQIIIVSTIAAKKGVNNLKTFFKNTANIKLFVAAIDETLTDKGYISPGLGDAGDLAFGNKLQH